MAKNPVYVHRILTYIRSDLLNDEVNELVSDLVQRGYLVKVTAHQPQLEQINDYSQTNYSATVQAVLKGYSKVIDIGLED